MAAENQKAFTLIEVLVTLAIVMILIALFAGVSSYLKTRAERQLTDSAIEVINAAVEMYYDEHKAFPFKNRDSNTDNIPDSYTKLHLEEDITSTSGTVSPASATLEENDGKNLFVSYASSAALYYYLDKDSNCRQIIETISDRLVTNKDKQLGNLTITIGTETKDLPRFIDVWGMSFRYEYIDGYSFPMITSAGPDRVFGTSDDLKNQ